MIIKTDNLSMKKNIKNISYMFLVQSANYLFPLITIPIVARAFGPDKIGLLNYITAIISYFILITSYGFNFTGVRRLSRNKDRSNEIFSTIFTSQLYLTTICTFIFAICIPIINPLRGDVLLSIVIFTSCLSVLFTQTWFLQAYSDFKTIALLSFCYRFTSFVLIIFFINSPGDVILYAAIINIGTLVFSLLCFFITIKKYKLKLRISKFSMCISYLKEDRSIFFSSVITSLYTTSGIVMLGAVSSNQEVGYYTSAQKLIDVTKSIMLMPISQVIFPILSEKFGKNRMDGIKAVQSIMPAFFLFSLIVLIFMISFGGIVLEVIFGGDFSPASPMLTILSFGLFAVFYGVLIGGQVMLNLGMDKEFLNVQVIVSVASLAANYLILPFGGGVTTSIVWTLSEFFISAYQIMILKKNGISIIGFWCINPRLIIASVKKILNRKEG